MSRIHRDLANGPHQAQANGHASTMQSLRQRLGRVPNVAIVGAGVSGLRCADILIRSGVPVTIYEARDRIGGRLHQQKSGGHLMDMGPNWIHGSKGNPIIKLAEKTGTAVLDPEEDSVVFDSKGNRLPSSVAHDLSQSMWSTIVSAFEHSDENSSTIDPQLSLYDYFKQVLSRKIHDPDRLQLALDEARMWGPVIGDPIEKQSLKFFFLEECIDGGNVFVAGTYKDIIKEIARTAVGRNSIKFRSEITHFTSHGDSVQLTTAKEEQYEHDEVVITSPLGWLKRHQSKCFTPPLPERLGRAINNINYGRLEKLYVTFPRAWWLDLGSKYPLFTDFHAPTYHPFPSSHPSQATSKSWSQSVLSLSHLPGAHSHPTLLFYVHGDCAAELVKSVTDLQRHSSQYNDSLVEFAEPFYSLLPNYDAEKSQCQPTSLLCTTWQSDEWAGNGSYCNFQVGLTQADEDVEVMRDSGGLWKGVDVKTPSRALGQRTGPEEILDLEHEVGSTGNTRMKPGGIFFAGEHVAPFVALGTTTGAYWSGEGVARRLCGKWGIEVGLETPCQ